MNDGATTRAVKIEPRSSDNYDDDDDDRKPPAAVVSMPGGGGTKRRKLVEANGESEDGVLEVTEVAQVGPPFAAAAVAAASVSTFSSNHSTNSEDEGEEEVQLLSTSMPDVFAEFPHAREHCRVYPFQKDPTAHCKNCYCFVCDVVASDCAHWHLQDQQQQQSHCHAVSTSPAWRQLRLQKQQQQQQPQHRYYSVRELLAAVTRVYPREMSPTIPHQFRTELMHYQKQALGFAMDVETNHSYTVKSGWLCSEVGMGKSAVVIALIVSNPMPLAQQPTAEQCKGARFQKGNFLDVKATVIFTSKSLLGQWEDEIRKHAPQLVVCRHHGNSKIRMADLARADVIVSCPTVEWSSVFRINFRFHRVVLDESHLLGSASARLDTVLGLATDRSWCVTATPMVSSGRDLEKQVEFLRLEDEFRSGNTKETLQKHMLRHTKSQIINGAAALALPESTTEVKMIPMTEWERKTFKEACDRKGGKIYGSNRQIRMIEMRWYYAIMNPLTCEDSSKIVQLEKDLRSLLEREPNMRAVVFTQLKEQHRYARMAVKSMGLKVYSFCGSASAEYRDRLIREFQDVSSSAGGSGGGPAVFLITMLSGSVGITLTAASHVFMLEPSIDPAKEVQAAGRIHRLGQTKKVGVTKYVFEDSCESNIQKLHEKIAAGSIQYMSGMLNSEAINTLAVERQCNGTEVTKTLAVGRHTYPWR